MKVTELKLYIHLTMKTNFEWTEWKEWYFSSEFLLVNDRKMDHYKSLFERMKNIN